MNYSGRVRSIGFLVQTVTSEWACTLLSALAIGPMVCIRFDNQLYNMFRKFDTVKNDSLDFFQLLIWNVLV